MARQGVKRPDEALRSDDSRPVEETDRPTLEAAAAPGSARRASFAARNRRRAWILSLAGYIPFAFLVAALFVLDSQNPQQALVVDALKAYGAVILSFLGGIRWGLVVRYQSEETTGLTLVLSVVPSLIGWVALFLPVPLAFGLLALGFAAQGAWDALSAQSGEFGLWFARLRTALTLLVVGALVLAVFATAQ